MIIAIIVLLVLYGISIYQRHELSKKFDELKENHSEEIKEARKESVTKSKAINKGKTLEVISPFLPSFPITPDSLSFVGDPIDFLAFTNVESFDDCEAHFVEVKTGSSRLNKRQKNIKNAIENKKVNWHEFRADK